MVAQNTCCHCKIEELEALWEILEKNIAGKTTNSEGLHQLSGISVKRKLGWWWPHSQLCCLSLRLFPCLSLRLFSLHVYRFSLRKSHHIDIFSILSFSFQPSLQFYNFVQSPFHAFQDIGTFSQLLQHPHI